MTHEERFAGYHRKAYLIEQITALASTMTSGQIAAHLRITRNQVMGIVHRNGIKLTSGSRKTKAKPISPIRQHGPLSVNFKKKVKNSTVSHTLAADTSAYKQGENSNLKASIDLRDGKRAHGDEATPRVEPKSKPRTKPGGAWASVTDGCRFVLGEVKALQGCNMPVVHGSSWCDAHHHAAYDKSKPWVHKNAAT